MSDSAPAAGASCGARDVAVYLLDDGGGIASSNDAGARLLQHPDAQALRRALADPAALAAGRAGLATSTRLSLNGSEETRQTVWVSILGDGAQRLVGVAAPLGLDPTGITTASFRGWIDDAPAMVGYLDEQGHWLAANRELQQRLGFDIEELRSRTLPDLLSETDREFLAERVDSALRSGLPDAMEVRLRTRSGEPVDVELATAPQPAGETGAATVCVLIRDVRDRKQREAEAEQYTHQLERLFVQLERKNEALEAANGEIRKARLQTLQAEELTRLERLKTAFLDVAAHELRTPVTLLTGILDLLRACDNADMRDNLLDSARRSTTRLANIVDSALKLLYTGDRAPGEPFRLRSLADTLRQAAADVQPFVELRGQTLECRLDGSLPEVEMDASMVRDVAVNLLMNAIRFSPDGGTVRLELGPSAPGWVKLCVADCGTGIRDEDLPHIFDDFFCSLDTLHHSSGQYEYNTRGPGLGLAIVRRFVDHHHGDIDVSSEPDRGTTFTVRLPIRRDPVRDRS